MPMTIEELSTLLKDVPDDTEFEFAGKKVKAGDFKGLTSAEQKRLDAAIKDATTKQAQAVKDAEQAAKILADLTAAEKTAKEPPADADDFDTNNWWTPVRKRLDPITKQQQELMTKLEQFGGAITKAIDIWSRERWQSQYDRSSDRLKKSDKHKSMSYDDVLKYAVDNKLVDGFGFPSIEKAVSDLTKEDELAAAVSKAREEGLREGMTRARLNATPRPTSASGAKPKGQRGLDADKNFEDLGDAVMDDPELAELVAQVQGIDPETLQ